MNFKLELAAYTATFPDGDEYEIIKTNLNNNSWKIKQAGCVLGTDLQWRYEPLPSNRSDEFLHLTRMELDTAFLVLMQWKDKLENGDNV